MLIRNFSMAAAVLMLAGGCGTTSSDTSETAAMKSGRFFDGNISGVDYRCESGFEGTLTEGGEYSCPETDETVTFKVGDYVLATVPTAETVTPEMVADGNESEMLLVTRQLLGADSDRNISNGIDIDPSRFGSTLASEEEAVGFLETYFSYVPSGEGAGASSTAASDSDSSEAGSEPAAGDSSESSGLSSENAESSSVGMSSESVSSEAVVVFPETPQYSSSPASYSAVSSAMAVSSSSAVTSSVSSAVSSSSSSVSSAKAESSPVSSSSAASSSVRARLSVALPAETEAQEWYVRLVAEAPARGMKTQSAQLGELTAPDTVEKHTLKALEPFGGSYLDIVFVDPAGVSAGEYKVSFHLHRENEPDSWRFTVKTDDNRSDIIVSWRGLFVLQPYTDAEGRLRYRENLSVTNPLLKKMQIVDEKTGETLPVVSGTQMPAFIVNMEGENTRTFRWELLTQNTNATAASAQPVQVKAAARHFIKSSSMANPPAFDLSKPPAIREK